MYLVFAVTDHRTSHCLSMSNIASFGRGPVRHNYRILGYRRHNNCLMHHIARRRSQLHRYSSSFGNRCFTVAAAGHRCRQHVLVLTATSSYTSQSQ